MLTNKGKYGLKAMVHLAGLAPDATALVADIAASNEIPKKFLDAILAELRNAGLVRSKKGRGGGYALSRPSRSIMVGQIVRALDGPLAPIRCASTNYYERCQDCASEKSCPVHRIMLEVRNAVVDLLDNRSLDDLRATEKPLPGKRAPLPLASSAPHGIGGPRPQGAPIAPEEGAATPAAGKARARRSGK